jgi:hypothetical protein
MNQIVDCRLLFRRHTLSIEWADGTTQHLPLNFLGKQSKLHEKIISFRLHKSNQIELTFSNGDKFTFNPKDY